ncbi:MAG TPA: hypothetical protein VIV60_36700 [Polyangiaceae bacterium]
MTDVRRANTTMGVAKAVLATVILSTLACEGPNNDATPVRAATWAVTPECSECMANVCVGSDTNPHPMAACAASAPCSEAFEVFTNCFHQKRTLVDCSVEVERVKSSGTAGTELLQNCFLLDCFSDACERRASVNSRPSGN